MKDVTKRIRRLEDRFGIVDEEKRLFYILALGTLALPEDRCVEILRECGFMSEGGGISLVDLTNIPEGLHAKELERFLRENGAVVCGPK